MLFTAELRWFMTGKPDPDALGWFRVPAATREPRRVDAYLTLPGVAGVGVKVREGMLEIKARRGPAREVTLASGLAGLLEHWVKVSNAEPADRWPDASWITVSKVRLVRRLSLTGEPVPARPDGENGRPAGCDVELTEVRIGDGRWWTIGLEAFGSPDELEIPLLEIAGRLLERAPASLSLTTATSGGYPEWLARVTESEAACP